MLILWHDVTRINMAMVINVCLKVGERWYVDTLIPDILKEMTLNKAYGDIILQ